MTLDHITKALLASYETEGGINHLDGINLPSDEAVNRLASDFMHLLFPGFFEQKSLSKQDVPAFTATRLHSVLASLAHNLETSLRFYRGLGFHTEGIIGKEFEYGAVVFIQLQPGLRLALWPRKSIGHDTGLTPAAASPTEMTLGHNVSSKAEVDAAMADAGAAGATIVKPAHDTFYGGYSGYFQDPDGHLWEVVWNPQWTQ